MELIHHVLATAPLSAVDMADVRRRTIFECCKWDHQVGDVAALSDCALVVSPACWADLAVSAENLFRETLQAEAEIAASAELIELLALPRPLESVLISRVGEPLRPDRALRVMRFDFHPTTEGWKVSEVNSDVPGGYIESSGFSRLMALHFRDSTITADPVAALVTALRARQLQTGTIGLVHATAYTDDRQVMVFLQRELQRQGIASHLLSPADLDWRDGAAHAAGETLDVLFRFFPVEWLPNLKGSGWKGFFDATKTIQVNPGQAVISQSKRFPLTWAHLSHQPAQWVSLSPETIAWRPDVDDGWVCKPAFGRVGDGIGLHGATTVREWKEIRTARAKRPREWIAQRRFDAVPCTSESGRVYPCLGVYVVDGRAAGIYGRIARRPLVDHLAQDVAVLVMPEPHAGVTPLKIA
jgi:glutathionylspermidine synthase